MKKFDLVVIGSGPGGCRAAIQGAKAGKTVAVIEETSCVGGMCVSAGTIPSKSFRESVYRFSLGSQGALSALGAAMQASGPGGQAQSLVTHSETPVGGSTAIDNDGGSTFCAYPRQLPDMVRLLKRRDRVVADESLVIRNQLGRNGITILEGRGAFAKETGSPGEHLVHVKKPDGSVAKLLAGTVVLATGSSSIAPAHLPVDRVRIHDNDSILSLKELPKSMVVLGAGIIGCEYASMFGMAGTQVILVDKRPQILSSCDSEIVQVLMQRFQEQNVSVVRSAEALSVTPQAGSVKVLLSNGQELNVDVVLVALGRKGNSHGLGLENVGITPDERGLIPVKKYFQTEVAGIYAVGDVIGSPALASTAMEQGRIAALHAFAQDLGESRKSVSEMPKLFPYGIYTIPEISMIGKTEDELKLEGVDYIVGRSLYRELARGQIVGDHWGILKMLVDRKSLKLLGVHILGDNAADLIHIGQAVMLLGGDVHYFVSSVFNYPTLAEAYKTAAFHAVNQLKIDAN